MAGDVLGDIAGDVGAGDAVLERCYADEAVTLCHADFPELGPTAAVASRRYNNGAYDGNDHRLPGAAYRELVAALPAMHAALEGSNGRRRWVGLGSPSWLNGQGVSQGSWCDR
jgi:hypothetical protein